MSVRGGPGVAGGAAVGGLASGARAAAAEAEHHDAADGHSVERSASAEHAAHEGILVAPSVEAVDPVCGMTVEVASARYKSQYNAQTYYFCAAGCQRRFEKDPAKYLS